jgi:hypothetical protein
VRRDEINACIKFYGLRPINFCVSRIFPNAPNMRRAYTHTHTPHSECLGKSADEIAAGRGRGAVLKRSEYNLF